MKDETYVFIQDVKEKGSTARSARNRRTHNGKGGRVKFPSDNLSKKELNAMNGEVKSYRLNSPVKWEEFKAMPDDIKVTYIKLLREKFDVPDKEIADMLGVDRQTVGRWFRCLGLGLGKCSGGRKTWDKDRWFAWCNGMTLPAADPAEDTPDENPEAERQLASLEDICDPVPVPEVKVGINKDGLFIYKKNPKAIPCSGNMIFEGRVEDVLNSVSVLLGGANVHISITWDVLSDIKDG